MAMDVKGITWVGNIFQKFEDIYVEVEDAVFEETVKYIGNQMQTVGESVKKIYSDVMQDLLPDLGETSASELPIDQCTDVGFSKKSFQGSKKITVKADTNQKSADSRINDDVDNDVIHAESCDFGALFISGSCNSVKGNNFISHERQCVGNMDIKSNLGSDENKQNKNMLASETGGEISLSKTDTCRASQSFELSHVNQNHAAIVSKPASAEETTIASVADCCTEIENDNTEEIPNVQVLAESAEEKKMHISSYSSSVQFGDPHGITMDSSLQPDNCSYHTIIVSHPETWDLDLQKIGTIIEQGHRTMQQDDELKLEETCVMVTRDELQSAPNEGGNLKTSKNKKRQPFSLSKKVSRRQEYEELAILHVNNEKGKGDCAEILCPTSNDDHKKLMLPDTSEPEWELL